MWCNDKLSFSWKMLANEKSTPKKLGQISKVTFTFSFLEYYSIYHYNTLKDTSIRNKSNKNGICYYPLNSFTNKQTINNIWQVDLTQILLFVHRIGLHFSILLLFCNSFIYIFYLLISLFSFLFVYVKHAWSVAKLGGRVWVHPFIFISKFLHCTCCWNSLFG